MIAKDCGERPGFGLISIVITALILAIAVPPIAGLFTGGMRTVTHSEAALLAEVASSDLLERLTDPRFAMNHLGETLKVPGLPGVALMEPFASRYHARAVAHLERVPGHASPVTASEENGLIEVEVELSWEEPAGPRRLDTSTLIADLAPVKPSL